MSKLPKLGKLSILSSLRARLLLLVLLSLIPALGLILYTASEQRRTAMEEVQENALRLAKLASNGQEQIIDGSRQLLTILAQVPVVRAGKSSECDRFLYSLMSQFPAYASFGVVDAQGNAICNSLAYRQPVNVSDRPYFQQAVKTRQFAIGEYEIDQVSRTATLAFAYPVLDPHKNVQAVLIASLDLAWLNNLAAQVKLPEHSIIGIVDRNGILLTRYPEPEKWVGKPLREDAFRQMKHTQGDGLFESSGLDGVARIFAFTTVGDDPFYPDAYVRIGIPLSEAYLEANRLLVRNLLGLGTVTVLALVAAWIGSDIFLLRQVKSLVGSTQRLKEGDLSTRSELTNEAGELGHLARAFNNMANALEDRVNELQTLFDVIPISIMIAENQTFEPVRINPTLAAILGVAPGTNASFTPITTLPKPPYRLCRNGQDLTIDELPLRIAAMQGIQVRDVEVDVVRDDGTIFNLFGCAAPLLDEQGNPRGAVGAFLDITERKRTEKALRHSEEQVRISQKRLQIALEGAELGTWDYDLKSSQILWSDRCKTMFGIASDQEDNYKVFLEAVHPEDRERVNQSVQRAIAQHQEYDTEMRSLWPDGSLHWIRSIGQAYYDAQGVATRMAGVTLDITDRKQAEHERERLLIQERKAREAAERANRIKDEFLAVLSHELRTPLNPILGWTRLLRTGRMNETKTAQALETIERNAKLQTQLIEDLLDVSRILRGKLSLNMAPVNLVTIIEAAIETVQLAAEAKGIDLIFEQIDINCDETDLNATISETQTQDDQQLSVANHPNYYVLGDASRLQQVVWNLLSNAVKFTPGGGRVEVYLKRVREDTPNSSTVSTSRSPVRFYDQISITDTGKGISPEFLPHVFDYFRQADSSTTRIFGGLGLGLAIVRHIVELHGGTVYADSPGEGQGATFTVELPSLRNSGRKSKEENGIAFNFTPDALPLNGLQVLVVDDEKDARELMAFVLEQAGAVVTQATSATEALTEIERSNPDILLSDIGMPEMDGYALVHRLRKLSPEAGGQIPAIALTAYAGDLNRKQALEAGFQMHVSKPFEPKEIVQAISELVAPQQ